MQAGLYWGGAHSFSVRSTEGVFRAFWPLTLWDCYSICLRASDRGGENGLCLSKSRSLKWGEAWLWDPVRLLGDDDRRDVIVSWWVEFGVWTPIRPFPPLSHWIVNTLLISILASTATAGHSWDLRARLVLRQDLCFYSNKDEFVLTLGTIVPGYLKWNFESIIWDYRGPRKKHLERMVP